MRKPIAPGNLLRHHQNWETWNTRTINTWARYFRFCRRSWECQQVTQRSQYKYTKQIYWYGEWLWLLRWKPTSILGRIICWLRKSTRTQNSRILKVCSILLKSWWENIQNKFCMWNAWNIHVKRSNGQRQKYVSMLIPFCRTPAAIE